VPVGAGLVGIGTVIGQIGKVEADLNLIGTVYVGREAWSARTEDGSVLSRGQKISVVRQDGLTLIVRRVD
jgi:membrane-bound ClpP family serine protease